jgi:hypothetical protein
MGTAQPNAPASRAIQTGSHCVAVVYEHALLGEGIARLVACATGVEVLSVWGEDAAALASALAIAPCVVIIERGLLLADLDLATATPSAFVIELSAAGAPSDSVPGRAVGIAEIIDMVRCALAG